MHENKETKIYEKREKKQEECQLQAIKRTENENEGNTENNEQ